MHRTTASHRDWIPQAVAILLVALAGTVPFWLTDLDIRVAGVFYHPEADDPWFEAQAPLWAFLYVASPLLTGLVMLGALLVLAASGIWEAFRRLRCYAILLIAATILGPGLIVNGVFKENWGRPRPHQVEQLGGTTQYVPPLALSERGKGKSFPCGHSSVGYMLGVFFLIWLRRRPVLAWTALAGSLVLGTLLGIGRMAAGDHFLSDVVWSWVIAFGVVWALYYFALRIPQREAAWAAASPSPMTTLRRPRVTAAAYAGAAALMVGGVLLATPLKNVQTLLIQPGEFEPPPRVLRLVADQAYVILFWPEGAHRTAQIRLEARGFGLPWSKVEPELTEDHQVLTYRISHRGLFTEKDTKVVIGIVASEWDRVEVRVDAGDIRVHPSQQPLPEIDLQTADGEVIWVES
ncbi:MAG: phosphatase PAP2 family protein [Thiocapsa sp.]|jgi:membrane-associated PAP2 superfamily phosphatase|nr:phosphatase PAP2 family protein [Thiocapsa sp.]MCG6896744.1 phosphatase PAP2 family protein [Thiocapsa sp.]MCG6984056.1 phosphatase PAP2 family protein [Thiocapsa sp.]